MIIDHFKLALKNLGRRRLRSWLTMTGIFVSIAIIFVLISLSLGLQSALAEHIRTLGADKFFIYPSLSAGIPGPDSPVKMSIEDFRVVEKVNGVKSATYMSMESGRIEFSNKVRYFMLAGFPTDRQAAAVLYETSNLKLDEGKYLDPGDNRHIILGSEYKYGNIFDMPLKVGDNIIIENISFKVKGILASVGNPSDDQNIYMAIDDMKELFGTGDRVDTMIVQAQEGVDVKEVALRVEDRLRSFRGVTEKTQDFAVVTPEELLKSFQNILNIIFAFLIGVASISLVVGGIGIANTMYTAVLERTKEIGIMKAVGARNSDILKIFLIESGLLGLVGGILGVVFGIAVGQIIKYIAINQLNTTLLQPAYPAYLIIGCLVFAFAVGAVFGVWPARRASKIRPVIALRYE